MDKVLVQVDDGIPGSEYFKHDQREVIKFLRIQGRKPAETQVNVCWAWFCMCTKGNSGSLAPCFEQAASKPPACQDQGKNAVNEDMLDWMKFNMSVSTVHAFVQDLGY